MANSVNLHPAAPFSGVKPLAPWHCSLDDAVGEVRLVIWSSGVANSFSVLTTNYFIFSHLMQNYTLKKTQVSKKGNKLYSPQFCL